MMIAGDCDNDGVDDDDDDGDEDDDHCHHHSHGKRYRSEAGSECTTLSSSII